MSGLIYEIAWVRSLELVFGTTTFAVATVLAAFMGGLACGSYSMGRFSARWRRFHPLHLYAVLEVLIAVVALFIPVLLHGLVPLYQWVWKTTHASFLVFSLIRFALSALILLVPTFFMGATLPVVSSLVSAQEELGEKRIGLLYSFNTLGAVLGCAAAGLYFFPALGLAKTQWVAVALNLLAAAGAVCLGNLWRSVGDGASPASSQASSAAQETSGAKAAVTAAAAGTRLVAPGAGWLVAAYGVSGFVAMLYEVAWSRVLVLVLGSSTYACTIMLATFLLGLAGGAWVAARRLPSTFSPLLASGLCQLLVALATYASVLLVEELPFLYLKAYEVLNPSPTQLLSVQFLLAMGLMLLPTLGLGAMFPITIQGLKPSATQAARVVGWAYALNTVGAIAGSVFAGFWLVPRFGSQKTMLVGIGLNLLGAAGLLFQVREGKLARYRVLVGLAVAAIFAGLVGATPRWDPAVMSSGVFRYVRDYLGLTREAFRERARKVSGEVLLFDEGLTCTVTVFRNPECLSLLVNGKPDASTPSGLNNPFDPNAPAMLLDLPTQILLGQIPMLLAPQREQALVIGLGSGLTVGSVLTHPVKRVECVELEDAVVRGSRFFESFNGRPLTDPRLELVVNDARNHLLVTERKYDVVISEPSNPWIPGAANLFTREFFELSRQKLQDDGVFCQWIQIYELQPEHFQTILRTFVSVFPEVHLFRVNHDAILVGSRHPHRLDVAGLRQRFTPAVRADLARIRIEQPEGLLARYWVGGEELKPGLESAEDNTDDNMRIEFAAPLQILTGSAGAVRAHPSIAALYAGRTSGAIPQTDLPPGVDASAFWAEVGRAALRERLPETMVYSEHSLELQHNPVAAEVQGVALLWSGKPEEARALLEQAESEFPNAVEAQRGLTLVRAFRQQWEATRRYAERWVRLAPDEAPGWFQLGRSLFFLGRNSESLTALERIPRSAYRMEELKDLPFYLGAAQAKNGQFADAAEQFRAFLRREPAHVEARVQLADALHRSGHSGEAAVQWQRVAQIQSVQAGKLQHAASVDWAEGRQPLAVTKLEQALRLDPANADVVLVLARMRVLQGEVDAAAELLSQFLAAYPDRPPALGYLSQLRGSQQRTEEARQLAERYRALTGNPWEEIRD